jgi:hypothetical protein
VAQKFPNSPPAPVIKIPFQLQVEMREGRHTSSDGILPKGRYRPSVVGPEQAGVIFLLSAD